MHLNVQRRLEHVERAPTFLKRQLQSSTDAGVDDYSGLDDGLFTFDGPITLTLISRIRPTPVPTFVGISNSAGSSLQQTTSSTSSIPQQTTSSTSSIPQQTTSSTSSASTFITADPGTKTPSQPSIIPNTSSKILPTGRPSSNSSDNTSAAQVETGALASGTSLSGGSIAGIIIGLLIVLGAILIYFLRSRSQRNRKKVRDQWGTQAISPLGITQSSFETKPFTRYSLPADVGPVPAEPYISTRQLQQHQGQLRPTSFDTRVPPTVQSIVATPPSAYQGPFAYNNAVIPPPAPPVSYYSVNPAAPAASFLSPAPATYDNQEPLSPQLPKSPMRTSSAAPTGMLSAPSYSSNSPAMSPALIETTVVCTFVTTLPDELSITVGDTIYVVAEYDDGWALCMNPYGEQGMVPVECLNRGPLTAAATYAPSSTATQAPVRTSRRVSSLPQMANRV